MLEQELVTSPETQLPDLGELLKWKDRVQTLSSDALLAELDRTWAGFNVWEQHFRREREQFVQNDVLKKLVSELDLKIADMVSNKSQIEHFRSRGAIGSAA